MSVTEDELDEAGAGLAVSLMGMLDGMDHDTEHWMGLPGGATPGWATQIGVARAAREAAKQDVCGVCGQDLADHRPVVYGPARRH